MMTTHNHTWVRRPDLDQNYSVARFSCECGAIGWCSQRHWLKSRGPIAEYAKSCRPKFKPEPTVGSKTKNDGGRVDPHLFDEYEPTRKEES